MRRFRHAAAVFAVAAAAVLFTMSPAQAAGLRSTDLIAFVRAGNLFVATGTAAPVQITTGGGYEWPRWAAANNPGGIAYIHNGDLFVAHYSAGSGLTGTVQITSGADAGAASWAPDGHRLAFVDNNIGLLEIADISTTPVTITTLPTGGQTFGPRPGLSALFQSVAVAWSPNGTWIAFRGGECEGQADDCLSIRNLTTGDEATLKAFGGSGGGEDDGFASVPAWSADSTKVYWSQQANDPFVDPNKFSALQIWHSTVGDRVGPATQWGRDGDSEIAPFPGGGARYLLTATVGNKAWVAESENSVRTLLYQGYQPTWTQG